MGQEGSVASGRRGTARNGRASQLKRGSMAGASDWLLVSFLEELTCSWHTTTDENARQRLPAGASAQSRAIFKEVNMFQCTPQGTKMPQLGGD